MKKSFIRNSVSITSIAVLIVSIAALIVAICSYRSSNKQMEKNMKLMESQLDIYKEILVQYNFLNQAKIKISNIVPELVQDYVDGKEIILFDVIIENLGLNAAYINNSKHYILDSTFYLIDKSFVSDDSNYKLLPSKARVTDGSVEIDENMNGFYYCCIIPYFDEKLKEKRTEWYCCFFDKNEKFLRRIEIDDEAEGKIKIGISNGLAKEISEVFY